MVTSRTRRRSSTLSPSDPSSLGLPSGDSCGGGTWCVKVEESLAGTEGRRIKRRKVEGSGPSSHTTRTTTTISIPPSLSLPSHLASTWSCGQVEKVKVENGRKESGVGRSWPGSNLEEELPGLLIYHNFTNFRMKLFLSLLSGRPVLFKTISPCRGRHCPPSSSFSPGLSARDVSLLSLVETLTAGGAAQLDGGGTALLLRPGALIGGDTATARPGNVPQMRRCVPASRAESEETVFSLTHTCEGESIPFFLEMLIILAPFCKYPVDIILEGYTNSESSSIDTTRTVTLPNLKKFLQITSKPCLPSSCNSSSSSSGSCTETVLERGLSLCLLSRSSLAGGRQPEQQQQQGAVRFRCPLVSAVHPFRAIDAPRVCRVRGVSFTAGVSANLGPRMGIWARKLLDRVTPDVFIYNEKGGIGQGYGLSLTAQLNNGFFKGADRQMCIQETKNNHPNVNDDAVGCNHPIKKTITSTTSSKKTITNGKTYEKPEEVGTLCASRLLCEVKAGGAVDSAHAYLPLLFMALADDYHVSKVLLPPLSSFTINWIRHLYDFFRIKFRVDPVEGSPCVVAQCIGAGFRNGNRRTF